MRRHRPAQFDSCPAQSAGDICQILSDWPMQPAWREQRRPLKVLPKAQLERILKTCTQSPQD